MRRVLRAIAVAVASLSLVATAACDSSANSADNKSLTKLTYLTAFSTNGRDAFAWVAQEKGWFKQAGLDVTIQPGAGAGPNLKLLSSGQADFAALDLTGAIIGEGSGQYSGVRAVAAIHQRTLVSIITYKDQKITSPKDLDGKTIAQAAGSVNKMLFPAYAKLTGINASSVKWQDTQPTQLASLLASGKVDALSTFLISTGAITKAGGGKAVNVMPYSDYLTDLYGNALFTTNSMIKKNPALVKKFRDVMLKALTYTIKHPEEAAAILHKAEPASVEAAALGEIKLMTPYVSSASSGVATGAIDQQRVARSIALLQNNGLIKSGATPDQFVDFSLTPGSS